jgi:hypothetical protein
LSTETLHSPPAKIVCGVENLKQGGEIDRALSLRNVSNTS